MNLLKEFNRRVNIIDSPEKAKTVQFIKEELMSLYNIHKRSLPPGYDKVVGIGFTMPQAVHAVENLFKTKEEVLKQERRDILGKYLTKETIETEYTDYDCRFMSYSPKKVKHTSYIPDEATINKFLSNYDEIMIKFKELDDASI